MTMDTTRSKTYPVENLSSIANISPADAGVEGKIGAAFGSYGLSRRHLRR
ncbi:MAG: hypothetical protein JW705_05185 [Methanosarcinaceae archaeon]|nr:hypothetical protein [Methanosarcinaceae archaeon]